LAATVARINRVGYRRKPRYIILFAIFYFLIPFLSLYQFYQTVDGSPELLRQIALSRFFLSEIFFSVTAGIAILMVNRVGFIYFIALSLYTVGVKIHNLQYNALFEYPFDLLVILFWFITTALLLFTTMRVPYLNPKTRWWKQATRYKQKMSGCLKVGQWRFPIVVVDYSVTGALVRLDGDKAREDAISEEDLAHFPSQVNQVVDLEIVVISEARQLFDEGKFVSQANVVWCAREGSDGRYGLGLQYLKQSRKMTRQLKRYARLLASLHRESNR
jgi:hypothetical protein